MPLPLGADEQPPRPTRHSQRARRAPAAPDKTPPPPAAPPPKAPRRRRQPAPPSQPSVDPDPKEERARVPKPALAMFSTPTSPMPLWAMVLVRQKILLGRIATMNNGSSWVNEGEGCLDFLPGCTRWRKTGVRLLQHHSANPRDKEPKPFAPSTSTGILRRHLYERHLEAWVQGCDHAREALPHVEAYRGKQNGSNSSSTADSAKKQPPFSNEAFVDAIVEWIVSDDQSINVIENEKLRNIFLMLRFDLKDSDIPHRTKIRKRVMEIWDDHLDHLQDEMAMLSSYRQPCKAVLSAITNMDFAAPGADDFVPGGAEPRTFLDAIARDPIATVRTSVRVIRASSLRRQYFSEVLKALHMKDLQLLRDVDTRWSSTLIMIDRAVLLQEAIDKFLTETQDLKKYKLSKPEWEALKAFQRILSVPHAFQQRLSAETTLTLAHALPAFEAMISQWEKQQTRHPETADIVQQGIDKLDDYRERSSIQLSS
ncbi:hypothetical protein R3P38DRAFT_3463793 [Favolaschia claudopus]|uniref:Uncharacterized protein n=1 Tax=Favolaschia claudopus TaxID=2862362 RepID=A0AAV9ZH53_9AGAR